MKRVIHSVALAVGLLLGASAAQADVCGSVAGNLVTNCGFETGDFTGWTVSGNDVPLSENTLYGVEGDDFFTGAVNSGSNQVFLSDFRSNATTLSQTLSTVAGATYFVTFYLAEADFQDQVPGTGNSMAATFGAAGTSQADVSPEGYTEYSFFATATSASTTLNLTFGNDIGEFVLDDVSVKVPEPATPAIVAAGLFAAGWVRSRQRGGKKEGRNAS